MPGPPRQRRGLRYMMAPVDPGGVCAVIMAAHKATRWILEAIESIDNQVVRPRWSYELRIGVDGCEETSRVLQRVGRPHWFSPVNVGPYVMRNSLIQLEPAGAYAIFDADDLMRPTYLSAVLEGVGADDICGAGRAHVDENRRLLRRRSGFRHGVAIISAGAWARLGGYRAWPVAADHDLILRAKALGVKVRRIEHALYLRRVHKDSLTQQPRTGFKSELRRQFANRARELTQLGKGLTVHPVTTPLEPR